ncbi:MAG: hypothetical protein LBI05_07975 [Planctomycetaceae bacterium]|nr:hypothetical protein [Planctomycetaceae bacterium]
MSKPAIYADFAGNSYIFDYIYGFFFYRLAGKNSRFEYNDGVSFRPVRVVRWAKRQGVKGDVIALAAIPENPYPSRPGDRISRPKP